MEASKKMSAREKKSTFPQQKLVAANGARGRLMSGKPSRRRENHFGESSAAAKTSRSVPWIYLVSVTESLTC